MQILKLLNCVLFGCVCTILFTFKLHHQTLNLRTCWPYVQSFEIKMDRQLQGCNVLNCAQDVKQRQSRAGITAYLIHLLAVSGGTSPAPGEACSGLTRGPWLLSESALDLQTWTNHGVCPCTKGPGFRADESAAWVLQARLWPVRTGGRSAASSAGGAGACATPAWGPRPQARPV